MNKTNIKKNTEKEIMIACKKWSDNTAIGYQNINVLISLNVCLKLFYLKHDNFLRKVLEK